MTDQLVLHPKMTAMQIAEWCQRHRMFVTINYTTDREGFLLCLLRATKETEGVPALLRPQAE